MTTIQLSKSGIGTITIYASKIEETVDKEIITWMKEFLAPAQLPITPTKDRPTKYAMDLLNLTREWTIVGTIDGNSITGGNALNTRVKLLNMLRSGEQVNFIYGTASDISPGSAGGYSVGSDGYYDGTGFTVHIKRIMIVESTKGGSGTEFGTAYTQNAIKGAPEQFEVNISLIQATDMTA